MKKIISFVGIAFYVAVLQAQTWIWYPGDYEIWLGNRMNNRRTERGAFFPPFWKTDSHYVVIEFSKQVDLERAENIFITAEGKYNVKLDGKLQFGMPSTLTLPAGKSGIRQLLPPFMSKERLSIPILPGKLLMRIKSGLTRVEKPVIFRPLFT